MDRWATLTSHSKMGRRQGDLTQRLRLVPPTIQLETIYRSRMRRSSHSHSTIIMMHQQKDTNLITPYHTISAPSGPTRSTILFIKWPANVLDLSSPPDPARVIRLFKFIGLVMSRQDHVRQCQTGQASNLSQGSIPSQVACSLTFLLFPCNDR
jgi:hypothetical protein